MEWLAQYAEFGLVNEQKLALVFVREVGTIDNATYRQLDSSITHARARLDIHKLCDLGFIEKKGQGCNTYYIRTSKVVSLEERLRPQGERLLPLDERLLPLDERLPPQHGTFGKKIPPQHGTFSKKIPPQHGTFGEKIPPQHGTFGEEIPPQHGTLGKKIPPQHGTFEIETEIAFTGNLYAITFWIIAINQVTISIQVSLLFSCLLQQFLLPTRKLGL